MNTKQAAAAYRMISQGFFELAVAIEQPPFRGAAEPERAATEGPSSVGQPARSDTDEWPPLDEFIDTGVRVPVVVRQAAKLADQVPQGSLSQCPKHKIPFKEGKFGSFCPAQDDEPNWSNAKGYCSITPKNVDVWLRQHSGVPA